jgi:hypothetical protein
VIFDQGFLPLANIKLQGSSASFGPPRLKTLIPSVINGEIKNTRFMDD